MGNHLHLFSADNINTPAKAKKMKKANRNSNNITDD